MYFVFLSLVYWRQFQATSVVFLREADFYEKITLPGTLCRGEKVSKQERFLGYLVGPLGFGFLSIMVNSYLNVYYTDVCGLGRCGVAAL